MKGSNDFIDPVLSSGSADTYSMRNFILKAIRENIHRFEGRLLDVGCGKMPYRDFIYKNSRIKDYKGLDIPTAIVYDENIKADFFWDGITMPFEDNCFETVIATEVLEHCPQPEVVLKEIYRVLKPGGTFFFTVPFLWNLHEVPHDEYRYTPFSLARHLNNSGFSNHDIKAHGGWHASLAQLIGLWVKRAPMSPLKRRWLTRLLVPVIRALLKRDVAPKTFTKAVMIPGLYGTATRA